MEILKIEDHLRSELNDVIEIRIAMERGGYLIVDELRD